PKDDRVSVAGKRDRITFFGRAAGVAAYQLGLFCPSVVRSSVNPDSANAAVVGRPSHRGGISVLRDADRKTLECRAGSVPGHQLRALLRQLRVHAETRHEHEEHCRTANSVAEPTLPLSTFPAYARRCSSTKFNRVARFLHLSPLF